ncbi:MAG: hypothetical protein V6Z86_05625 [Hyphomicrobiales bacterium]
MRTKMKDHTYLGDGVYVMHDGWQAWLTLGSHDNTPLIALDHQVLVGLARWINTAMPPGLATTMAEELTRKRD